VYSVHRVARLACEEEQGRRTRGKEDEDGVWEFMESKEGRHAAPWGGGLPPTKPRKRTVRERKRERTQERNQVSREFTFKLTSCYFVCAVLLALLAYSFRSNICLRSHTAQDGPTQGTVRDSTQHPDVIPLLVENVHVEVVEHLGLGGATTALLKMVAATDNVVTIILRCRGRVPSGRQRRKSSRSLKRRK
jgi:hypothetical protein